MQKDEEYEIAKLIFINKITADRGSITAEKAAAQSIAEAAKFIEAWNNKNG